jgi:hypothetical protein
MSSLTVSDDGLELTRRNADPEHDQKAAGALAALRAKLELPPSSSGVVASHLEPPVWDPEEQCGRYVRTGEICHRQALVLEKNNKKNAENNAESKDDNDENNENNENNENDGLLPCRFRLFPRRFLRTESPFTACMDATLCRFLRARDYDVDQALELYGKATALRAELNADDILRERDPTEAVWQNGTPHYHYGHDRLGRPFYIERSGRVKVGKLMPPKGFLEREDFKHRHVVHMEYMARRIEHARLRHGEHISQLSQIMDLEGLSYFGDSRGMTLFKDALEIDQNAYPEYLGNLFLINAPLMFRGMWAIIKNWIDPKTVSKFVVLGADYQETLLKYIDASELPEVYGGTCTLKLPEVNFDLVPTARPDTFRLDALGLDPATLETEEEEEEGEEEEEEEDGEEPEAVL